MRKRWNMKARNEEREAEAAHVVPPAADPPGQPALAPAAAVEPLIDRPAASSGDTSNTAHPEPKAPAGPAKKRAAAMAAASGGAAKKRYTNPPLPPPPQASAGAPAKAPQSAQVQSMPTTTGQKLPHRADAPQGAGQGDPPAAPKTKAAGTVVLPSAPPA
eukprot:COSAG05_NODE_9046_length_651_cov_0.708333_1_plen_159_part_10